MNALIEPADREPDTSARPSPVRELLLVVGLFLVYKLGRQVAGGHVDEAYRNADHVWDFERWAHLPDEGSVQRAVLHSDSLVHIANTYYATVHFPAIVLFLAWLYWRRPRHYVWTRRVLTALTGAALVLHLLVPLAPPRMLAEAHLVDTGQRFGPTVYAAAPAKDTLANQFAAMPSLHFGWALMIAIGLIAATRSRYRWLWLLHPLITLLVIVATANHYWLDSIVAAVLLAAALVCIKLPAPKVASTPEEPPAPATAPVAPAPPEEAGAVPVSVRVPRPSADGARPEPVRALADHGGCR
ncbi:MULTISPECIES: phosphatase PAP2 family protein [unclassified Streptomyces]|uniref:phosphatase PAP2 family protein n=1 Tax=unclassified Streptomyces TaxID=2593676 RepID=UPI002023C22E|nr:MULTISPECIES: phosphatase PAP2 family protein [unclassified Streptomyces]WSC18763.1 phosphatase PAP2 family protein [Streptomyces sp. NBC_01766]